MAVYPDLGRISFGGSLKVPKMVFSLIRKDLDLFIENHKGGKKIEVPFILKHRGCVGELGFLWRDLDPPKSDVYCPKITWNDATGQWENTGCSKLWKLHEVQKMSLAQLQTFFYLEYHPDPKDEWPYKLVKHSNGITQCTITRLMTYPEVEEYYKQALNYLRDQNYVLIKD
jgi:hypothetical protein